MSDVTRPIQGSSGRTRGAPLKARAVSRRCRKWKGRKREVRGRDRGRSKRIIVLFTLVTILVLGALGLDRYFRSVADTILEPVVVAGIDVGGLTTQKARARLLTHLEVWINQPLDIRLGTESWSVPPQELGVRLRLDDMLSRALAIGNSGSVLQRVLDRLRVQRQGVWGVPIMLDVNGETFDAWLDGIAARFERSAESARLHINEGQVLVTPSVTGHRLDRAEIQRHIEEAVVRKAGRVIHLTLLEIEPELTTEEAYGLGITGEIASYTTHFDPTNYNRTVNIRIAAETLSGVLLAPGEEFSFNKRVGPRVESLGYKEAPVIVDGELVPDIGGGICQVSSTLYNAVLMAGLHVTHRVPHSLPSTYVPLGLDATVAYDYIDFRFRNDNDGHVLLHTSMEDDRVTISLYGGASEQQHVRLMSQIVGTIKPRSVETPSEHVEAGSELVVSEGRDGYRVQVWRIAAEEDGRVERQLVSHSVYKPRARVIWVPAQQG